MKAHAEEPIYTIGQKPACRFHYDEQLETRALMTLQRELHSKFASYYDAKNPLITVCRKKAILIFSMLPSIGTHFLDPPNIFIDVDVCSHHILEVGRDSGTEVTDAPPCQ